MPRRKIPQAIKRAACRRLAALEAARPAADYKTWRAVRSDCTRQVLQEYGIGYNALRQSLREFGMVTKFDPWKTKGPAAPSVNELAQRFYLGTTNKR